jgi:hypothetical protein
MENPHTLKQKVRSVLKAATCGGALFAAITVVVIAGGEFWWEPFFLPRLLVEMPANLVTEHLGFAFPSVVVNTVLGALVFAAAWTFWQFVLKNRYEK